MMVFEAKIDF